LVYGQKRNNVLENPGIGYNTVFSIQVLRAVAAWHVVFHHFYQLIPGLKGEGGVLEWYFSQRGTFGVDIFFVISGFIMMSTPSHINIRPATFFLRRIFRIIPTYWFFTLLLASLAWFYPVIFHMAPPMPDHIIKSLFFIPHSNPDGLSIQFPLLAVGWTLFFELIFYLIFALTLIFPFRRRLSLLLIILAALVFAYPWRWPASMWLRDPLMLEFGLGAMIAHLRIAGALSLGQKSTSVAGILLLATSMLMILLNYGTYWRIISAGLLVTGAVLLESLFKSRHLLSHLGDISYSTYLSHGIVIITMTPLFYLLPESIRVPFILFGGIILVILASHLGYRYLEQPSLLISKAIQRRLLGNSSRSRAAV
jgi:exopolysaccharide production protein ExoZ